MEDRGKHASFASPEGHRPRRSLGQNFLVDPGIQRRIVDAALTPNEWAKEWAIEGAVEGAGQGAGEDCAPLAGGTVLEIGPGKGALTEGLAAMASRLILVELDRDLAKAHRQRWADASHVEVVEESILDRPLAERVSDVENLIVVGNIPYHLTSPILFFLLQAPRPARITLMVQREVADRILASPGTKAYGALSVGVRTVARPRLLFSVPAGAFRPRPRVESAVIQLHPFRPPPLLPHEELGVRDLTRALFQWRRKQLGKILRDHPALNTPADRIGGLLETLGFTPDQRPETLSPEGVVALWRGLQTVR